MVGRGRGYAKGVASFSPGLLAASYPGNGHQENAPTPTGLKPVVAGRVMQPRWGWCLFLHGPRVGAKPPTLGCMMQRRWRSPANRLQRPRHRPQIPLRSPCDVRLPARPPPPHAVWLNKMLVSFQCVDSQSLSGSSYRFISTQITRSQCQPQSWQLFSAQCHQARSLGQSIWDPRACTISACIMELRTSPFPENLVSFSAAGGQCWSPLAAAK